MNAIDISHKMQDLLRSLEANVKAYSKASWFDVTMKDGAEFTISVNHKKNGIIYGFNPNNPDTITSW